MAILQTRELKKYYGAGDTLVKALDGVELSVENGEFVAIIGTSGSGKSTLLHMLGGLDRPTSGTVTVDGRELSTLKDEELTIFRRRKIGFVFQAYNLVPVLSVYENIVLPIQLDGGAVDESYVREVIAVLGLEKKLDSLPGQLSGGQHQPGCAGTDEGHRAEVRPDHGDDHPQRGDRPVGRPHRPHRGRAHRHAVRGRGYERLQPQVCVHPGTAEPAGQPHP